ncbi:MAG: T9SS type A sorting domain-containing protein [Flavobacteriaceae bacterium]|nr:T9SS type A sorting domain-containing protein [Flavobacteriaceae bacterium]
MKNYLYIFILFCFSAAFAGNIPTSGNFFANEPVAIFQDKEKVVLTPNPASSYTFIKITNQEVKLTEVAIYSLLGNKLFTQLCDGSEESVQINVQNFKRGKYLVKVSFADGSNEVKALIKQ